MRFFRYFFAILILAFIGITLYFNLERKGMGGTDGFPGAELFLTSPEVATARFLGDCKGQPQAFPVPSKEFGELYFYACYYPATQPNGALLILSSGTHGAETFVGSAVQAHITRKLLPEWKEPTLGVLMIHGLNPYGFRVGRRTTENNVDLNRNFVLEPSEFDQKNEGYERLEDLLEPRAPASARSFSNHFFFLTVLPALFEYSLEPLRQSILQGQYTSPKGLFYGGQEYEPQYDRLVWYFKTLRESYKTVLLIDIHTGYGERGKLHLYPNPLSDPAIKNRLEEVFAGYPIDYGDKDKMYTSTGSYADYWKDTFPDAVYLPMTFEFGTLDSQTLRGSLQSLRNMILENQGFHYGYVSESDRLIVEERYREQFYPSSAEWRKAVLEQAEAVLRVVVPRLYGGLDVTDD